MRAVSRSRFAATAVALTLLMAVPATAAETAATTDRSAVVTTEPQRAVTWRRILQASRLAASRSARRQMRAQMASRSAEGCANAWCGRQAVLMLGIGF